MVFALPGRFCAPARSFLLGLAVAAPVARAAGKRGFAQAIVKGAALRVRPVAMTDAVIIAGLLPIMFGSGTGSEVMRRIAAPMVGGTITAPLLSTFVVPVAYILLRRPRAGVQVGAPRNQFQGGAST